MPSKKKRVEIPEDVKDEILFLSDRTCCKCHTAGKPVQIHHIDEDPANNDPQNLAVLCLECHDETQVSGGFGRKLSAGQVRRYRDDWLIQVTKRRTGQTYQVEGQDLSVSAKKLTHYLVLKIGLYGDYSKHPVPLIAHELGLDPIELSDAAEELQRKECARRLGIGNGNGYFFNYITPNPLAWYYADREVLGFDVKKDMLAVAQCIVSQGKGLKAEELARETGLPPDRLSIAALILGQKKILGVIGPGNNNGEYQFYFTREPTFDTREWVKKQTV